MQNHHGLEIVLILLATSVFAILLFNRLKLGSVLAYLMAGSLLSPYAFGLVQVANADFAIAELGVVMLLFLIGLEISPQRLTLMRRHFLLVGGLQILLTMLLLFAASIFWGEWRTILLASFALAISSTAIGVQLLSERKELNSPYGRLSLAIFLFQDVIAIPVLALIPLLGVASNQADMSLNNMIFTGGKLLGVLLALIILGRYLVQPFFRFIAATKSTEAFTIAALLVLLGTSWLTSLAGLSMPLGAFVAGVLLAESEFRHEIEANIEPFKGVLLGLFFLGVGFAIDWSFIAGHLPSLLLGVVALFVIKGAVLYFLARKVVRLKKRQALKMAVLLAQGGEFAFVLLSSAADAQLLAGDFKDLLTAIIVFSMAITPLLAMAMDRWLGSPKASSREADMIPETERAKVIIAGFGRMGQIVARVLKASRIPFIALEHNVDQIELSKRFGNIIYYGDPSRPEVLRSARVEQAEVFVITTDNLESNLKIARYINHHHPHMKIYARARNRQQVHRLMDMRVEAVVRETFHSGIALAEKVLEGLGFPSEKAQARAEQFRKYDEALLREQYLYHEDENKLAQSSVDALRELEQLFDLDQQNQDTARKRGESTG